MSGIFIFSFIWPWEPVRILVMAQRQNQHLKNYALQFIGVKITCNQDSKSLPTGTKDVKSSEKCIPHLQRDYQSYLKPVL